MKLGFNVLTPYGDNERYDFVIDTGSRFIKVQCKTSHSDDDGASFSFSCRSCNRKDGKVIHRSYTNDEIDYFITMYDYKCYLIPVEECGSGKRLRIRETKNSQTRGSLGQNNMNWRRLFVIGKLMCKQLQDCMFEPHRRHLKYRADKCFARLQLALS